jgi:Fur family ferric uptake transcriptional regulator
MENSKHDIDELLQLNGLSRTSARAAILTIILETDQWLTLQDILKQSGVGRITVYRALNILCEKGIVKKLVDFHNKVFFHFNYQHQLIPSKKSDKKESVYFRCTNCHRIILLEDAHVNIRLPEGFVKTGVNFFVSGYCSNC